MSDSENSIEDIDPELEEIYRKLSPKSERILRKKIKNKDARAKHKHAGWESTSKQRKKKAKAHKAEAKGRREAEAKLSKVEAKLQVEETRRKEAEKRWREEQQKITKADEMHMFELDEANNRAEGLQITMDDDTWTIESNQLAEGSRQHIAERVFYAMSPWLRSCVKGDSPSLAALTSLAFQYPGEIQERILGFPLADLQVVSDGFQVISDRRTDLTHPVKRLLDNDEKRQEGFERLWNEIIGNNHVSDGLRNILFQSQIYSMIMLERRRKKRERYENSPAVLAFARRRNAAAAVPPPPPLIEESRTLFSRKRSATGAMLGESPDSKKTTKKRAAVTHSRAQA